jgi:hypothetical protein
MKVSIEEMENALRILCTIVAMRRDSPRGVSRQSGEHRAWMMHVLRGVVLTSGR